MESLVNSKKKSAYLASCVLYESRAYTVMGMFFHRDKGTL